MKKVLSILLLAFVLFALTGCSSIEQMFHPGQSKIAGVWVNDAGVWVNDAGVKKFTDSFNKEEAKSKGDTYCSKCGKFIEGKVRICPYCGKYI